MANRGIFCSKGSPGRFLACLAVLCSALGISGAASSVHAEVPDAGAPKVVDTTTLRHAVWLELEKSQGNTPASVWRKLGKDVDLTVMDLASDVGQPLRLRVAAMRALGELDSQVSRSYLMRQLPSATPTGAMAAKRPSSHEVRDALSMARAAVLALGWTRSDEAIPAIERLLYHPDSDMRQDAIAALVLARRPQGLAALEFARSKEKDKSVRKKLDKQIDRLRDALKNDPAFREKPIPPARIAQPPPIQQRFDPNRPEQRL